MDGWMGYGWMAALWIYSQWEPSNRFVLHVPPSVNHDKPTTIELINGQLGAMLQNALPGIEPGASQAICQQPTLTEITRKKGALVKLRDRIVVTLEAREKAVQRITSKSKTSSLQKKTNQSAEVHHFLSLFCRFSWAFPWTIENTSTNNL